MLCQSASISSAIIIERAVFTPCPISELGAIKVIVPSEEILIHNPKSAPFVAVTEVSLLAAKLVNGSKAIPMAKPVPANVEDFRNVRRFILNFSISISFFLYQLSRTPNSTSDTDVSSAAAQISYLLLNLLITWFWDVFQQSIHCHYLS